VNYTCDIFQVWDREIILTTLAENYGKDMGAFRKDLEHNITKVSEIEPAHKTFQKPINMKFHRLAS
jgi:hypothetical protein